MNPAISVGIVCYKEGEKLSQVLKSLRAQTKFSYIKEVLLVHNGSCQSTLNTAKTFLNILPLSIIRNPINSVGKARNLIVEKSQCPLIAFIDGDCIAPKNWLESLILNWNSCQKENVVGIGGPNRLSEQFFWQKAVNLSLQHPLGHGWSPQAWIPPYKVSVKHIPTTNGLFLRDKIKVTGNFSHKIQKVGEDVDLGLRLGEQGRLYVFPQPVVLNDYAVSYVQVLQRLFKFGTIRYRQRDWLWFPVVMFFPVFILLLILGLREFFVLLPICLYFIYLFFAGFKIAFKQKKTGVLSFAFILPVFWFLQHCAYSLGAFYGGLSLLWFSLFSR